MIFLLALPQLKCEESGHGGRIYTFFLFSGLGRSESRSGKSRELEGGGMVGGDLPAGAGHPLACGGEHTGPVRIEQGLESHSLGASVNRRGEALFGDRALNLEKGAKVGKCPGPTSRRDRLT